MSSNAPRAGFWLSDISAEKANSGVSQPQYPEFVGGDLTWVEGRPLEGGRKVLVLRDSSGHDRTVTPEGFNLRSRVHEYGGRAHAFVGDSVVFANFSDQALYRQALVGGAATRITALAPKGEQWRFADVIAGSDDASVLAVGEHHGSGHEPRNVLVSVKLVSESQPVILHEGPDFVAMPALSPDGKQLAWLQWNHPCMQWDSSELWVADIQDNGSGVELSNKRCVAGGEGASVWQPRYLRDGSLVYVMDRTDDSDPSAGYWQIYRREGDQAATRLTHGHLEFGEPFWVSGECRIAELASGDLLAVGTDGEGEALVRVPLDGSGASAPLVRIRAMFQLRDTPDGAVFVGLEGDDTAQICLWSEEQGLTRLPGAELTLNKDQISRADALFCPARDGARIHAWYYPPSNPNQQLQDGELPPMVVKAHGGPTASSGAGLQMDVQFWTSRGFAYVDINYRGSTGLGRAYRQSLQGRWGELDIDDVVDVVQHLAQTGRADPKSIFIRGGSAGGYTVLRVLTRDPEIWAGGACRYGIGNLSTLAATTHKFESRYIDGLLGMGWKPEMEHQPGNPYRDRSPIFYIDQIQAPVVLFQGEEDKVVPPEVSREMYETLKAGGVPTEYHEYPGEGHGFRAANIKVHALETELRFFRGVMGEG